MFNANKKGAVQIPPGFRCWSAKHFSFPPPRWYFLGSWSQALPFVGWHRPQPEGGTIIRLWKWTFDAENIDKRFLRIYISLHGVDNELHGFLIYLLCLCLTTFEGVGYKPWAARFLSWFAQFSAAGSPPAAQSTELSPVNDEKDQI